MTKNNISKTQLYWFDSENELFKPISSEGENLELFIPKVELYWYDETNDAYKPLITDGKMPINEDIINSVTQNVKKDIEEVNAQLAQNTNLMSNNFNVFKGMVKPKILQKPSKLNHLPKLTIKKDLMGQFTSDFDLEKLFPVNNGKAYFINPVTGLDANDGLTRDTPFRYISSALSKGDADIIYLEPGLYNRISGISAKTIDRNIKFKVLDGGRAILGSQPAPAQISWSLHEDNVYKANRPQVRNVYELNLTSENNDFIAYSQKTSIADVLNTPASWYLDDATSMLYVHTVDGRPPDSDLIVDIINNNFSMTNNVVVYLENIDLFFGTTAANLTNGTLLAKNCNFGYSFTHGLLVNNAKSYMVGCSLIKNKEHGAYYNTDSSFIEIDCVMRDNSLSGSRQDASKGLRINGMYYSNGQFNINDTKGYTWNLGVAAFYSKSQSPTTNGNFNLADNGEQLLESCFSYGSNYSYQTSIGSVTTVKNSIFEGTVNMLGTLQDDGGNSFNEQSSSVHEIKKFKPLSSLDISISDSGGFYPVTPSKDGSVIYGYKGKTLYKSTDNWITKEPINTFEYNIGNIYTMDNGELIVCLINIKDVVNGCLYISSNNMTTWRKALESSSTESHFIQMWGGVSTYENIIVAGEYGSHEKARCVWLSKDYGLTFEKILDIGVATQRHTHGVAYDKWYERIWVVNGDGANKSIQFTDDWGLNWVTVSNLYQPVGIIPTEHSVLFTMDGSPNGVLLIRRTEKEDYNFKIEVGYHLSPESTQTLYCGQRHFVSPDGVIYMPILHVSGGHCYVLATKDGVNIFELYKSPEPLESWRGITNIFPLPNGTMIGLHNVFRSDNNYGLVTTPSIPQWSEI